MEYRYFSLRSDDSLVDQWFPEIAYFGLVEAMARKGNFPSIDLNCHFRLSVDAEIDGLTIVGNFHFRDIPGSDKGKVNILCAHFVMLIFFVVFKDAQHHCDITQ